MFARTPRLTLRPGWAEDAPALCAAIGHEAVVRRLSRAPWPYGVEDAAAFLAIPRGAVDVDLLIFDHDGGAPDLVGGISLLADGGTHELGYWLTPSVWGRGYASEAARAVIGIARHALGLRRLVATRQVDDAASARVLERVGFCETGRTRLLSRALGGEVACAVYELGLGGAGVLPLAA